MSTSANRSGEHPGSVGRWLVVGFLIVLLAAVLLLALRLSQRKELNRQAEIPLSDEIFLGLAAVLNSDISEYEIATWRSKIYGKLPKRAKELWATRIQVPRAAEWNFYGSPGQTQFAMYYRVPEHWGNDHRKIQHKLQAAFSNDSLYLVARYDNGWNSGPARLSHYAFNSYTDNWDIVPLYSSTQIAFPANQELLDLLVVKGVAYVDELTTDSIIGSFKIKNPGYHKVEPLAGAQQLPIEVVHGDVTVTLKALASKVQEDSIQRARKRLVDDAATMDSDDFVRAEGSFEDPYFGMVVLGIEESGTSETQWKADDPKFTYGKSQLPFPVYPRRTSDKGWNIFEYDDDPGMLEQPVRISVSLRRNRRFPADEIETVNIPLPAVGTNTLPGKEIQFWSGSGTVAALYKTTAELDRRHVGTDGAITMIFGGKAEEAEVRAIKLIGADGQEIDLRHTAAGSMGTTNHSMTDYFPGHVRNWVGNKKEYLKTDTTLSITLAYPRTYPDKFEFIANPIEATGKKQTGGWLGALFGL